MQDNQNLKRHIEHLTVQKRDYALIGDDHGAERCSKRIQWIQDQLARRAANRKKNEKQYRKAH